MKIEQTYLENHQVEVTVEADQETFEKAKHQAAKELAKGKKIPGYRPGKAPYQLILNHFGEAAITDQAIEHFLDEVYPKVIEEVDREPYGPGQVKEIKSLEPPTFVFTIPLQPEVVLGNYREIRLPYEKSEISGEDIEKILKRMQSQQAKVEPVDHPAEEGNLVDTSLNCRAVDSDPEDSENFLLKNQPLPVMIKAKSDDDSKEWPFPGFSRQLLGVSAGDVLELTHEFSNDDSVDENYRGKEVLYTVTVSGIRERILPDLNDEFVKSVSELESFSDLKDEIKDELAAQREIEEENAYINTILKAILENAEVKFPPQMVDNEIEGEVRELESRLKDQGMDLEMYLGIQDLTEEQLRDQIKPNAEKRIIQGLLIGKVSEAEDLNINPEDITSEFKSILDNHFGEDEKKRSEYLKSGDSVALLNRVSSQVITKNTLDFLMAIAQGKDISEFLKPADSGTDEETADQEIKPEQVADLQPDQLPSDENVSDEKDIQE